MSTNGKGDKPRPIKNRKQYYSNWDLIFSKKSEKTSCKPEQKESN